MIFWIVNCSIAFLICVFCAGIIIPQILLIAFRKRLFDLPDERKIHHCAVPRLGGIAFKPVVFFTVALLLGINMVMGHSEMLSEIENDVRPLAFAFCSIMVLYLVGMADDVIGIRYRAKFVILILCGMMLCLLSLKLTMCGTDDNTVHINPMVLAFSPLLIPCCDVVRVYLHRVRNGKNPFLPDKNHIHHKLLAVGMQQRSVMIIVISVSTVFILFNILLSLYLNVNWIVLVDILIWTFTNIRLTKRIGHLQSRQATNK